MWGAVYFFVGCRSLRKRHSERADRDTIGECSAGGGTRQGGGRAGEVRGGASVLSCLL